MLLALWPLWFDLGQAQPSVPTARVWQVLAENRVYAVQAEDRVMLSDPEE